MQEKTYKLLNAENAKYRWIKFYVDDDNDIRAEMDAVLDLDTAGDECFELMLRMCDIVDDAYVEIQKGFWA